MEFKHIRSATHAGVLTLMLSNPEQRNPITLQLIEELITAVAHADADDDVRAVIVTAKGDMFSAGADLSAGTDSFDRRNVVRESGEAFRDGNGRLTLRIFESLKPIVAAINGPAIGGGATLTLPMDVRLASDTARFGFVFTRRGLVPDAAASWFLPRIVGISTALEWVMSGRVFPADEALDAGLVRSLHSPADLLPAAIDVAHEIVDNAAPVATALTRQMFWRMSGARHPIEAHRLDSAAIFSLGQSPDAREGVQSFLEKRPPEFPMKVSSDLPDFFPWWTRAPGTDNGESPDE